MGRRRHARRLASLGINFGQPSVSPIRCVTFHFFWWLLYCWQLAGRRPVVRQGQVVAVADDGLDYNSCYFYDSTQPELNIVKGAVNPILNHRKV